MNEKNKNSNNNNNKTCAIKKTKISKEMVFNWKLIPKYVIDTYLKTKD